MTQEEKKLVIKDLCGRLPYDVIVQVNDGLKGTYYSQLVQVFCDRVSCSVSVHNPLKECICIDSVKPFLRPISSMTEEERKIQEGYIYHFSKNNLPDYESDFVFENEAHEYTDWLNAHHFDFRNLLAKGLAIEVTEEFNPYKD